MRTRNCNDLICRSIKDLTSRPEDKAHLEADPYSRPSSPVITQQPDQLILLWHIPQCYNHHDNFIVHYLSSFSLVQCQFSIIEVQVLWAFEATVLKKF